MALLLSLKRTVDLEPGLTTPQVFHVSQNDVGTKLYVGLEQGGTAYTIPEGTTAKVQGCNALGEPFEAITATVSASEVYFTITDQDVTQFAGNAKCEVVLTNGSNILGTANFIVAVEASPMGSDVPAIYTNPVQAYIEGVVQDYVDDDILPDITADIESKADASDVGDLTSLETTDKTSIVDAVNEVVSGKVNIAQGTTHSGKVLVVNASGNVEPVDALVTVDSTLSVQGDAADAKATGDAIALKANASIVASEFSTATAYATGSYVLKNGVLYKFTAAHSGAWTGMDAEVVTVGGELTRLTDDIKPVSGGITVVDAIEKMTDTSLTYLLSINKHWYFYNGSSWEDGGLFNGSEVPEAIILQIIAAYIANHTTPMKTLTIKDSGGNVIGVFDGSANAIVTINNVTYDDGNEVDY